MGIKTFEGEVIRLEKIDFSEQNKLTSLIP